MFLMKGFNMLKRIIKNRTAEPEIPAPEALLVGFDVIDDVFYSLNLFRFVIGDFDVEFFFKRHNELYDIKAVSTQVFDEFRIFFHFISAHAQLLYYNLFNVIQ